MNGTSKKALKRQAQFLLNTSKEFDEVWIMPAFKHMYGKQMASTNDRLEMCRLAAEVDKRIKIFDYEIKNELKGETYYFVKRLKEEHELNQKYHFSLVIGLDNALTFNKWVNYDLLERLVRFVVVPRKGYDNFDVKAWFLKEPHIFLNNENPVIEVSSSEIREHVALGEYNKIENLVPKEVLMYIINKNLYV